jgi:glycerol-1-phosphate dehydrogenase [NAD(P)+]
MDPHSIELPRNILVGNDVLDRVSDVCRELKISGKPLVLTGEHTRKVAGEKVAKSLTESEPDTCMEIVSEASKAEVERIKGSIPMGLCVVVSVGGGKVIDVGKLLAYQIKIPFISVPTAPSHDGVASNRVSLKDGVVFHSLRARSPVAIIADISILSSAPPRLIASGGADVISNYTAVQDWRLAKEKGEYYSEYAAALSLLSSEIVLSSAEMIMRKEERGIRNLVEALISSSISMSLVQSSRPASGSEHLFSHALDQLKSEKGANKSLHGEQCGVGSIISAYLQGQDWERIRRGLKTLGAPTTAGELGIGREMLIEALVRARDVRERYTILNEKPLDREKAEEACRATGVID